MHSLCTTSANVLTSTEAEAVPHAQAAHPANAVLCRVVFVTDVIYPRLQLCVLLLHVYWLQPYLASSCF